MQLIDAAGQLERLDSLEAIWNGALEVLAGEGVEFCIYLTVDADYAAPFALTNIPEVYNQADPSADPFLHHCCDSYDVALLGPEYVDEYDDLSEEDRAFIKRAFGTGYTRGLGVPMRLQGSPRFGGFNLGTSMAAEDFAQHIIARQESFRLFCLLVHRRIEEITRNEAHAGQDFRDLLIAPDTGVLADLSPREREVIYLVARGLSRKECARMCGISPYTVAEYTKSAYRKLGVQNRVEVARKVMGGS